MTEREEDLMLQGIREFRKEQSQRIDAWSESAQAFSELKHRAEAIKEKLSKIDAFADDLEKEVQAFRSLTKVSANKLLAEICLARGVTKEMVLGEYHDWNLVSARRDLAKQLRAAGWSTPRIGDFLGRHHTTVLNLLKTENLPRSSTRRRPLQLVEKIA